MTTTTSAINKKLALKLLNKEKINLFLVYGIVFDKLVKRGKKELAQKIYATRTNDVLAIVARTKSRNMRKRKFTAADLVL